MKKISKRIWAFVLLIAMVVTMLPVSATKVNAEDPQPTTFTAHVLVEDALGWNAPNIHYWGSQHTDWPGNALADSKVGSFVVDPSKGLYTMYDYDLDLGVTGIIINEGGQQTANIEGFEAKEMWIQVDADKSAAVLYSDPRKRVLYVQAPAEYKVDDKFASVHHWGSNGGTTWPGDAITTVNEDGWAVLYIDASHDKFIINNSDNKKQTDNLDLGFLTYIKVNADNSYEMADYDFTKFYQLHVRALDFAEVALHTWGGADATAWPGRKLVNPDQDGWFTTLLDKSATGYMFTNNKGADGECVKTSDQSLADLEAGKVWFDIAADGQVSLTSTKPIDETGNVVYFRVPDDFGIPYIHAWKEGGEKEAEWPGTAVTTYVSETGWFKAVLSSESDRFIINNKYKIDGVQSANIEVVGNVNYYVYGAAAATSYNPDLFDVVQLKVEANWESVALYEFEKENNSNKNNAWPGIKLGEADEDGWRTVLLDKKFDTMIFNNNNNGSQTADLTKADYLDNGLTWFVVDKKTENGKNKFTATATKPVVEPEDPTKPVEPTTYKVHVKPVKGWAGVNAYICDDGWGELTGEWPGTVMTSEENGWYSIEVDKGAYYFIFSDTETGKQTIDLEYNKDTEVWFVLGNEADDKGKYNGTVYAQNPDDATDPVAPIDPVIPDPEPETPVVPEKPEEGKTIAVHVKVPEKWEDVYAYIGDKDWTLLTGKKFPGSKMSKESGNWYTITVAKEAAYFIFSDKKSGVQTEDLSYTGAKEVWFVLEGDADNDGKLDATVYEADPDKSEVTPVKPVEPEEEPEKELDESNSFTVNVKVPATWSEDVYAYICDADWNLKTGKDWPGKKMTKGKDNWYSIKIEKGVKYFIFSDKTTSQQTEDLEYTKNKTVWFVIGGDADKDNKLDAVIYTKNPTSKTEEELQEDIKKEEEAQSEKEKQELEDKLTNGRVLYVKLPSEWKNPTYYAWQAEPFEELKAWPGVAITEKSGEWYKVVVPKKMKNIIFAANEGSVQTKDLKADKTKWFVVSKDGSVYETTKKPDANVDKIIEDLEREKEEALKDTYTVKVKFDASWTNPHLWAWNKETIENLYSAWPGEEITEKDGDYYIVKIPKSFNGFLFNNGNTDAMIQTKDLEYTGSDLEVIVSADGSVEIVGGEQEETSKPALDKVTVYVKVPADWASPRLWAWGSEGNLYDAWPGELLVLEGEYYVATIPTWVTAIIVNGNDGAVQTVDITLEEIGKDIYLTVNGPDDYTIEYKEVVPRDDVAVNDAPTDDTTDKNDTTNGGATDNSASNNSDSDNSAKDEASSQEDNTQVSNEKEAVFSPQAIMLTITVVVILICGVVIITILARKKAFKTKDE